MQYLQLITKILGCHKRTTSVHIRACLKRGMHWVKNTVICGKTAVTGKKSLKLYDGNNGMGTAPTSTQVLCISIRYHNHHGDSTSRTPVVYTDRILVLDSAPKVVTFGQYSA